MQESSELVHLNNPIKKSGTSIFKLGAGLSHLIAAKSSLTAATDILKAVAMSEIFGFRPRS